MPCLVGGKRAQKEEVFSIINLSLQSFVLCSGKQLWQQPVLIAPNILYQAVSYTILQKCESLSGLKWTT